MQIIHGIKDLTYLDWAKARHSSGTAGSFLKAFENRRGRKIYYKLSNYDPVHGITGHECVNELIADRLLTKMGIPHLSYRLIHAIVLIRGKETETYLCSSEDFKQPGESKIALDAFYEMEAYPSESPYDFCVRMGFGEYIFRMLAFDFLILNRDRHGANIEILKNKELREIRPAPLFDHGLSLLFSARSGEFDKCDPLDDKPVQCFVGSDSSYENLKLIPEESRIRLPEFNEELKDYLFSDISPAMNEKWINAVWNFLKTRADIYENFCDKK